MAIKPRRWWRLGRAVVPVEEPEPPAREPSYDLYQFRGCTAQRTKGDGVRGEDRIMISLPGCETEHVIPIDRAIDLWSALGSAIWRN